MKILVTGGAGFIGSHVVEAYIAAGHHVIIVDTVASHPVDILDKKKLTEIFVKEKPDIVNHHAAQIDVNNSIAHRGADAKTNIIGTINLLELCSQFNVKQFIFASSAAVYGSHEPGVDGLTEHLESKPLSPYGISKRTAEDYVRNAGLLFGLKYVILRYPNVFGPRQTSGDGGVISIFTKKMLNNEDVTIFGSGHQTRDFLFVEDAAQANVKALDCKADHETLNIGTGKSTSIKELFLLLKDLTGYRKPWVQAPEKKGEVRHSRFNIDKARESIKWTPTTELNDGLKKTIDYFKHAK
ncbi:MAG TPA: NAD-dependent epimerase/dehydratase family protein [Candidatus Nanoarchaeia archaeon]|nr:NAD-dependent epimerase/dehydratase family protein [Candidatus Nanoarchaeia archaeon]